jgi:hypothetical protein
MSNETLRDMQVDMDLGLENIVHPIHFALIGQTLIEFNVKKIDPCLKLYSHFAVATQHDSVREQLRAFGATIARRFSTRLTSFGITKEEAIK